MGARLETFPRMEDQMTPERRQEALVQALRGHGWHTAGELRPLYARLGLTPEQGREDITRLAEEGRLQRRMLSNGVSYEYQVAETPSEVPPSEATPSEASPSEPLPNEAPPSEASPSEASHPIDSLKRMRLADIQAPAELQRRVRGTEPADVQRYAELLQAQGLDALGALQVVEDPETGEAWLWDGFHRREAYLHIGDEDVQVLVRSRPGTYRDAQLLSLCEANATHGKQRTNADRRHCVKVALMDPDLCKLAGRALGEQMHVSHAFVNKERRRYGVKRGERLDETAANLANGVFAQAWVALQLADDVVREWMAIETLEAIAARRPETYSGAARLRIAELADAPWPWPEDETEQDRVSRVARLDTRQDLERALLAKDCPGRDDLVGIWLHALRLEEDGEHWVERRLLEGRPALQALAEDKYTAMARAREDRPSAYSQAQTLIKRDDPEEVGALNDVELWWHLYDRGLAGGWSPAFFHALRGAPCAPATVDCPDPTCAGWHVQDRHSCRVCGFISSGWATRAQQALDLAGRLLAADAAVRLMVAGREVSALDLQALEPLPDGTGSWTPEQAEQLVAWRFGPPAWTTAPTISAEQRQTLQRLTAAGLIADLELTRLGAAAVRWAVFFKDEAEVAA